MTHKVFFFSLSTDIIPYSNDAVAQAAIGELMERKRQGPSLVQGGGGAGGGGATATATATATPNDKTTMVIHARRTVRVSKKKQKQILLKQSS